MKVPSLTGCARRIPCQERGERRIGELLSAAIAEFAAVGYEAGTMQAIAERAGAPIGSLYQFFPNKQAVARALRTRHVEDFEELLSGLKVEGLGEFVERFVEVMVVFVAEHRAFLPLLDAPSSTLPIGARDRLRKRLEGMLRGVRPGLARREGERMAEIMLQVNKALMGLYARSATEERGWILREYRGLLGGFLETRLGGRARRGDRAGRSTGRGHRGVRTGGRAASGTARAGGTSRGMER